MKKVSIFLGAFLAVIFIGSYFLIKSVPPREPKTFGITFSKFFAERFNLDWKKTYLAVFDDLGAKNVRIPVYWPEVEPEEDKWDFRDYDWQIQKAGEHGAKIILAIGRKLPRWPECHEPQWVQSEISKIKSQILLKYLEKVVNHYEDNPTVIAWQIENEPFLPFGECPTVSGKFLDEEIKIVRQISDKPIMITDSGEFGIWFPAAGRADIFGSTLYRHVYSRIFGYITYPLPPWFFRLKLGLLKFFIGEKSPIVSELQAEPWTREALYEISIEDQLRYFNPERFKKELEYIRGTGFDTFYFWGAEWWYFLEQNNHPEMWEIVKETIRQHSMLTENNNL